MMSLGCWGDQWMDNNEGVPVEYVHTKCKKVVSPVLTCDQCGEPLKPEEVEPQLGEPLKALAAQLENEGERVTEIQVLIKRSMTA